MPAGITTSARAGAAVASARGTGDASRLIACAKYRLLPLDLFTAALLTLDGIVLLTDGADGFESLVAGFANIFIDWHGYTLLEKNVDTILPSNPALSCHRLHGHCHENDSIWG